MNDVTKQLILEMSAEMFREAVKVHYQHGIEPGKSLDFHNIARDSVQAAQSFYRVANQELYTPESGMATQREAYWWAHSRGLEAGSMGKPLNEPEAQETYAATPALYDAFVNGWHTGDERRKQREVSRNPH